MRYSREETSEEEEMDETDSMMPQEYFRRFSGIPSKVPQSTLLRKPLCEKT